MSTRVLEQLTLDYVKAASIGHHLNRKDRSHFNPEVSDTQRLAELGDLIGKVFEHAALVPNPAELQHTLLWLSATAAIWAELIDKQPKNCCPHGYSVGIYCGICGTGVPE
jgi:hypothetical protein